MNEEPMRYNNITRLGNWYERKVLEETRAKDYQQAKAQSTLKHTQMAIQKQGTQTSVPLTYSPDGNVRLGDSVMLANVHS